MLPHLNAALSESLVPITQFFLHASILKAQGHELAQRSYSEWVETMRRADRILQAVLKAGGQPSSREPTQMKLGRTPRLIFELDIETGEHWIEYLEATARKCKDSASNDTVSMLSELVAAERAILSWRKSELAGLAESIETDSAGSAVDEILAQALNDVLRAELSAITQVYYHGQLLEAWGANEMTAFMEDETWAKTWRSLELTDALLAAGGHLAEAGHGELKIGNNVGQALELDRQFVDSQIAAADTALEVCDADAQPALHDLLVRLRDGEQAHAEWIATNS